MQNLTNNLGGFDGAWSYRLDWSPDGKQIVYEHESGLEGDNLWIMNADNGSGKKRITPIAANDTLRGTPSWSPSGKYIMYPEAIAGKDQNLRAVESLIIQNVSTGARDIHHFPRESIILVGSWLGDDHTVLLSIRLNSQDVDSKYNIYQYELISKKLTNLTNLTNANSYHPHWIDGSLAVSLQEKLTTKWGQLKRQIEK